MKKAFVLITNESGVAEYFQGLSDYGNYEKFEIPKEEFFSATKK